MNNNTPVVLSARLTASQFGSLQRQLAAKRQDKCDSAQEYRGDLFGFERVWRMIHVHNNATRGLCFCRRAEVTITESIPTRKVGAPGEL